MEAIELKAKRELTNKSELIRRALLNYLSEEERAHVLREIHGEVPPSGAKPASGGGSYFKSRRRKQRS